MSKIEDERMSRKLKGLLSDSLELNCCNLINWNAFETQENVLKEFFKEQFNKEEIAQHEISKNIFKDFILRSNYNYPNELWDKELKETTVGNMFQDEIKRQFVTKELIMKININGNGNTTTMSGSNVFTNTNINTNSEIKRKKKSTTDKNITQEEEINKLKQQLEREINGLNKDNNTESDIQMSKSCVINIKGAGEFSNINDSQMKTNECNNELDLSKQQGVNNTITNNTNATSTIRKHITPLSSSLHLPNNMKYLDNDYDDIYDHDTDHLPDIGKHTNLLIALSNKSTEMAANQVKEIKDQVKKEQDLFKDEPEKENENIIYQIINTNKTIAYMSINLFLKKLVTEDFAQRHPILTQGFMEQYSAFINLDILINRIISAFNYYKEQQNSNLSNLISFLSKLVQLEFIDNKANVNFNSHKAFKTVLKFYKDLSSNETFKSMQSLNIKETYTSLKKQDFSFYRKDITKRHGSIELKHPTNHNKTTPLKESSCINNNFFYLFFYDPWDVANELTRITFSLFSQIKVKELLKAKFGKNKRKETSPNVVRCVERFDDLIYFIIEDIISYDRKRSRAQLIEKWINIAWECKELGNFNDCMIINTAFCNYLLRNLKQSWERVGQDALNKLNDIKKLCSFQHVYANIKIETEKRVNNKEEFIPYLGLLLKEISSLEEKYSYVKDDVLINFMKIEKVQIAINQFSAFQSHPYVINVREELNILESLQPKTQEELEELANKLEPKFNLGKKNRYGKRQTRTDKFYYENKLEEISSEFEFKRK